MYCFNKYINEKLITLGNRPKFEQVVILAGGAGSGKGFVTNNILGIEGNVIDVDKIKKLLQATKKTRKKILDTYGVNIHKDHFNLKDENNTSLLHKIATDLDIPNKRLKYLYKSIIEKPKRKPNLIFDVTLKDISKLDKISKDVLDLGYKKENIHIIWIINEFETAVEQNANRDRRVSYKILQQTHKGVSKVINSIITNKVNIKDYMDGEFWFVFNKKFADSFLDFSDKGGSYIKDVLYIKVKPKGKNMINKEDISNEIIDKIKSYIPNPDVWEKHLINLDEGFLMSNKGEPAKILDKLLTTFWKQNKWHKHGVLLHTINVVFSAIKNKDYKMIPAAFLHDIGKPIVATRDISDDLSYSFKGHEEASYDIIKSWNFISKYTKELVRYHYLIRGKLKSLEKYNKTKDEEYLKEYQRQQKIWDSLDEEMKKDLEKFLKYDDNGKDNTKYFKNLFKKYKG